MRNLTIRKAAAERSVRLWEIAEKLHIQDSAFSRQLRHELQDAEREKILRIIDEIAAERRDENEQ